MKELRTRSFRPSIESLEDRAVPATFLVNTFDDAIANDGRLSLREAISRANLTPGPDTIVLQAGKYNISLPGSGEDANRGGDFDVTDSLTIVGAGRAATVIQGDHQDRLFEAFGPINMTFANLTLRNGGNGFLNGGAVKAVSANITLNNCAVTSNFGFNGAAINAESGNVTLRNTTVANNRTFGGDGGGIFAGSGNVVLVDSTVSGNSAQKGGGIFAKRGNVTLSRSTVSLNRASVAGGGIAAEGGTVSLLNNSSVRRNVSGGDGGGVFCPGTVTLTNSTV